MSQSCDCNKELKLLFSCAGCADVGEMADRASRALSREGVGKLYCLAGIGAGLSNFIDQTKSASKVLMIDGCSVDCGKKILEKNGIDNFYSLRITDLGFEKGKTTVTDETVEAAVSKAKTTIMGMGYAY